MTPDGRLFIADYLGIPTARTSSHLTSTSFAASIHPTVAELVPSPVTTGVAYNPDTATLWWLNIEQTKASRS